MDKFVLKTWISRRVSYFIGILSKVGDIFLSDCSQIFSPLKVKFKGNLKGQSKEGNPLINSTDIAIKKLLYVLFLSCFRSSFNYHTQLHNNFHKICEQFDVIWSRKIILNWNLIKYFWLFGKTIMYHISCVEFKNPVSSNFLSKTF